MVAIDHYINSQPFPQSSILQELRLLVLNCSPVITEELKYKVPYYSCGKPFCYLNVLKKKVPYIGIVNGSQLHDEYNLLSGTELKSVRYVEVPNIDYFWEHKSHITALLQQALFVINSK